MTDYAWTAAGMIRRASDGAHIAPVTGNSDYDALIASGAEIAPYVPPPSPSVAEYTDAVTRHETAVARQRNFDGAVDAASYAQSTSPAYKAEALAFIAWRDAVWAHVETQMAAIQSGQRTAPTVVGLISELPAIQWPAT